jgi:16S rRNA (adenine1518-N6/adenine1519-N6)-dimethyltransferase
LPQKFGQHFLSDASILNRIAQLICGDGRPVVLEIGPGRGALTERLIPCASRVVAIEIDPKLAGHLRGRFKGTPNLEVVNADALLVDFTTWRPDIIAGNLPYYIATPLIERTIRLAMPAVFLIQKEVAQRLAAQPGTRDYGYLTVATQLFAQPEIAFAVAPGAFRPPPRVDSAVVVFDPRDRAAEMGVIDREAFLRFLSDCFRQKRKMLRNNLRGEFPIEGHPEASQRAEQLSLEELAALWRRLRA